MVGMHIRKARDGMYNIASSIVPLIEAYRDNESPGDTRKDSMRIVREFEQDDFRAFDAPEEDDRRSDIDVDDIDEVEVVFRSKKKRAFLQANGRQYTSTWGDDVRDEADYWNPEDLVWDDIDVMGESNQKDKRCEGHWSAALGQWLPCTYSVCARLAREQCYEVDLDFYFVGVYGPRISGTPLLEQTEEYRHENRQKRKSTDQREPLRLYTGKLCKIVQAMDSHAIDLSLFAIVTRQQGEAKIEADMEKTLRANLTDVVKGRINSYVNEGGSLDMERMREMCGIPSLMEEDAMRYATYMKDKMLIARQKQLEQQAQAATVNSWSGPSWAPPPIEGELPVPTAPVEEVLHPVDPVAITEKRELRRVQTQLAEMKAENAALQQALREAIQAIQKQTEPKAVVPPEVDEEVVYVRLVKQEEPTLEKGKGPEEPEGKPIRKEQGPVMDQPQDDPKGKKPVETMNESLPLPLPQMTTLEAILSRMDEGQRNANQAMDFMMQQQKSLTAQVTDLVLASRSTESNTVMKSTQAQPRALTVAEADLARREYRAELGVSSLTKAQAKHATHLYREKIHRGEVSGSSVLAGPRQGTSRGNPTQF